jgi:hypothetical protein
VEDVSGGTPVGMIPQLLDPDEKSSSKRMVADAMAAGTSTQSKKKRNRIVSRLGFKIFS